MLFYYTATGNSLYVAKQLDANPISIPQIIKNDNLVFEDETIGIVCPVFAGEMPRMVQEFLAKATFKTDYFYWVSTYGKDDTVHAEFAQKKCEENGIDLKFATSVLMVDNYLVAFNMVDEMAMDKKEDEQIERVKADIAARKTGIPQASEFGRNLYNMVQGRYKEHPEMNDGSLIAMNSEKCVGCGICAKVCPRGIIVVEEGKSGRTQQTCDLCMACAHACPQKAIGLKIPERNPEARFRHPKVSLQEIIKSNQQ